MSAIVSSSEPSVGQAAAASRKSGASETSVDLLCVGFGLSSIAIAAALADCNPEGRVCFFERQPTFTWGPANVLPENKIRTPFLRDLVTTRNPRSKYTFLNYLHSTDQLVAFTNASALQPSKLVMSQYLAWVAQQIGNLGWVSYGREVVRIEPLRESGASQVGKFAVHFKDMTTGKRSVMTSKRVVVATGSNPHIPEPLAKAELSSYVIHSADCSNLFSHKGSALPDVAVIGGSQEGAEVYENLQEHYGGHRASFFIEDSALRPDETTAFSQTLVDIPEADMAAFPPELRQKILASRKSKKEAPISLELLEHLYDMDYAQKIREKDPSKWRFRVEPLAEVVGAEVVNASPRPRVRLHLKNPRTGAVRKSERTFDVVVAATGYHKGPDSLLSSLSSLLDGGMVNVGRDYKVNFKNGALQGGCGVWSLSTLEDTASRDEVFLHLAEQGRRVSNSVISLLREEETKGGKQIEQLSML